MVAGGGASVVYADTIADFAGIADLANYGEYSGGPTTGETKFYALTNFRPYDKRERPSKVERKDFTLFGWGLIWPNFTRNWLGQKEPFYQGNLFPKAIFGKEGYWPGITELETNGWVV